MIYIFQLNQKLIIRYILTFFIKFTKLFILKCKNDISIETPVLNKESLDCEANAGKILTNNNKNLIFQTANNIQDNEKNVLLKSKTLKTTENFLKTKEISTSFEQLSMSTNCINLAPSLDKVELSYDFLNCFKGLCCNNTSTDAMFVLNYLLSNFSPTFIRLKEKGKICKDNFYFVYTLGVGRNDAQKFCAKSKKNIQEAEKIVANQLVNYLNSRIKHADLLTCNNLENNSETNLIYKNEIKLASNIDKLVTCYKQSKIYFNLKVIITIFCRRLSKNRQKK